MKTATITDLKNRLSYFLDLIKSGQQVIILDRNNPIAKITSLISADNNNKEEDKLIRLERAGLINRASSTDIKRFLKLEKPKASNKNSLLKTLLQDREDGR